MTINVAVKVPSSPSLDAPQDAVALVLLHHDGHFRLLERTLRGFQHLERQLPLEAKCATLASVLPAIEAYCAAKPGFYPVNQLGVRLAIALEDFIRRLLANAELLATSTALKTFLNGNLLTSHEVSGRSYREAVEAAIRGGEQETEMMEERVAAGCVVEHQVAVDGTQLVIWKFASHGRGLVFSAEFSSGKGEQVDIDPYSVSNDDVAWSKEDEKEVAYYRTNCDFKVDDDSGGFVYGHFVAEMSGVLTFQWGNVDMSSVVSKPLRFQVKVVPLTAAGEILVVVDTLKTVDTAEWLNHHVDASEITLVEDLPGWGDDEPVSGFGIDEDHTYDDRLVGGGPDSGPEKQDPQIETAVMAERTHELEAHVMYLEESLATTKKELRSALDRVHIAEEIYKANLETITQLECATVDSPGPKALRIANVTEDSAATPDAQLEGPPSNELERVQKLCAGFQEQCLWRSVENMELEAQLAASQVLATSWRDKHEEQAGRLEELEKQNRTLRTHKKMLVQEVKRLQPYSQVNLAALVQEAQEARMVQRSLQAKLDSHEQFNSSLAEGPEAATETGPTDFVLVEASDDK